MQGNVLGQSGGSAKINGIIEEYKVASGGNVNAGDFVRFLSDYTETNETNTTNLITGKGSNGGLKAEKISNNKVFITYGYKTSDNYNKLHAMVCTIDNNTITPGINTLLSTIRSSNSCINIARLSENKVFITYAGEGYNSLNAIVCTINGTTISPGIETVLSSERYTCTGLTILALSEDKVFISHDYGDSHYLYGIVCTINGRTITAGTDTKLNSTQGSGHNPISLLLENDNIIIFSKSENYATSPIKQANVYTISGTSMTLKKNTIFSTTIPLQNMVKLSNNKILILYYIGTSPDYILYGSICTINSDFSATLGEVQTLKTDYFSTQACIPLTDTTVLLLYYKNNTDYYLYGTTCTIEENIINTGLEIQLTTSLYTTYGINGVMLEENKIFIIYGESIIYGMILDYLINLVKTITSSKEQIDGVAKTGGNAGEIIKAYKPNI